ncbi:hypothetical protein LJY25_12040 [Hymenobacter sp. BT175]|uniref:hypothetical protein n=1 Tax=Hymenobacter translucens TaxID=2886507 RepID=UPI001D0F1DCE|nr:hypothetical protein [Hymenobacter translucens]MCC2547180.1 hypothetical protein [Hymenobacter translucens]
MKLTQRLLLAVVLGASATLAACDRAGTPGQDRQNVNDFSDAPPATSMEVNADSVNGGDEAYEPIGTGSAADQRQNVNSGVNHGNVNQPSPVPSNTPDNGSPAPVQGEGRTTRQSTAGGDQKGGQ